MANIAINGFGRTGRATFKLLLETPGLDVVGINDLVPTDNLAYLLKYDTVYGRYEKPVQVKGENVSVGGREYAVFHEKDPAQLPWSELKVDIALECTGVFTRKQDLERHLQAGARYALLSAPSKSEDVVTVVYGVNTSDADSVRIASCASCTTNCITPVAEVMGRRIGVKKAIMTTVHAYTSSQSIVDGPNKRVRRGRAGAANFVPTSTGAALATTRALPEYVGKFDGVAVRAPVPAGSIADIIFVTKRETSVAEVNGVFREESTTERYMGVLGVTEDPIVSSDVIRDTRASVVDLGMTQVVDSDLVKVMSWYDNEWGYAAQMVRQAAHVAEIIQA
jgi:glyceraldehyde 3-phosphate dehydrogenase